MPFLVDHDIRDRNQGQIREMPEIRTAEQLKEDGNKRFQRGEYQEAIDLYTEALQLQPENALRIVLYRNRAMVRLKIEDYEGAENDCDKVLELDGADSKALYRRALAREQLEKVGQAFKDAKEAARLQPGDKKIQELCEHLVKLNTEKMKLANSTENRVKEMLKMSFNEKDQEQKKKAMNNLLVLARESEDGARKVWQAGMIVNELLNVVKDKENWPEELAILALHVLDELIKKRERAMKLIELVPIPVLTRIAAFRDSKEFVDSAQILIERLFSALAAMDRSKNIKPDPEIAEKNKLHIIKLILELEEIMTDPQYSAAVREMCVDLFLKNLMHMDGGLPRGWSWRFVEDRGLLKLLHLASQIPEQCDYPVSAETRQHVALCLARLYDDMVFDTKRAIYSEKVEQFFNALMANIGDEKTQIKMCAFLITMLQGAVDLGMKLVTNDAITALMLQMAGSTNKLHQYIAVELIVQTVSKHERAMAVVTNGIPVLRKLFNSDDHNVKVRALVGLCKCASAGGDDYSKQTMEEGTTLTLAKTCKEFLLDTENYSVEVRRFACEALSYLTLDADVKEAIVTDEDLLKALVSLGKVAGALCVFTLANIFVNLTNSYEKPKVEEELVKLAQFAKHHVPETHPLDTDEYVDKRVKALVKGGAVTACVAISKTESKKALELLARCMLAFTSDQELCGQIVSEGGAKLCLTLYKEADEEGRIKAAHALAKLGVASDPNITFAGQRMYEVVKPMVELLHPEVEGIANYDALLTLTNLASVSDSVRKRILKEKAVPKVEEFWFMTDHEQLRAAAAEFFLNMLFLEEFFEYTVKDSQDRIKLWALYCDEGEDRLQLASSAGFAMLTQDETAAKRFLDEISSWPELFVEMAQNENPEVQRRCIMGIANIVEHSESLAARVMATEVFRILVAVCKVKTKGNEREGAVKEAQRALDAAEKFGLIKPSDREIFERKTNLSTVPEV
uniref:TPR_REGION domain-containing protein n=2 Tax=Bursaphelenchus xylophilus TaxID=6326 RepID=A0A1I7RKR3_BURXY